MTATADSNAIIMHGYPDHCCLPAVQASDAYLFAGAVQNDYSSVGYSLLLKSDKMVNVSLMAVCCFCWLPPLRHITTRHPGMVGECLQCCPWQRSSG